jgi:hypothetical protein
MLWFGLPFKKGPFICDKPVDENDSDHVNMVNGKQIEEKCFKPNSWFVLPHLLVHFLWYDFVREDVNLRK